MARPDTPVLPMNAASLAARMLLYCRAMERRAKQKLWILCVCLTAALGGCWRTTTKGAPKETRTNQDSGVLCASDASGCLPETTACERAWEQGEGASCTEENQTCSRVVEECPRDAYDLHEYLVCEGGIWTWQRDVDCETFPFMDDGGAADTGEPDPCAHCAEDEICVQHFDGSCLASEITCRKVSEACRSGECTPECWGELCDEPYTCDIIAPCGNELGATINCYGP